MSDEIDSGDETNSTDDSPNAQHEVLAFDNVHSIEEAKKPAEKQQPTPKAETDKSFIKSLPWQRYDYVEQFNFIEFLFPSELLLENETPGLFAQQTVAARPIDRPSFFQYLGIKNQNDKAPAYSTYITVSTLKPNHVGDLLAQKPYFSGLFFIYLDDIGTGASSKVPWSAIPSDIYYGATHIESSPENFQLFLRLKEPIRDQLQAQALLTAVVHSSNLSDAAPVSVVKKARMIGGVHGKESSLQPDFQTRIGFLSLKTWEPQELLDACGVTQITWLDIQCDTHGALEKITGKRVRNIPTPYTQSANYAPYLKTYLDSLFADPMIAVLQKHDLIYAINDHPVFPVTVRCPRGHEHSNNNPTMGFSPLGYGATEEDKNRRFVNCFHEHKNNEGESVRPNIAEFLNFVFSVTGRRFCAVDRAFMACRDVIVDSSTGTLVEILKSGMVMPTTNRFPHIAAMVPPLEPIINKKGEEVYESINTAFLNSPSRITVKGVRCDPLKPDKLFIQEGSAIYINKFNRLEPNILAPLTESDHQHIAMFERFLTHLFTDEEQRCWIRMMLARKIQQPSYRGWPVIFNSRCGGVGRDTFAFLMQEIIGPDWVVDVDFKNLALKGFNEYATAQICYVGEIEAILDDYNDSQRINVGESLKKECDTSPARCTVNTKYEKKIRTWNCSWFWFYVNDIDKVKFITSTEDRRFLIVENPHFATPDVVEEVGALWSWTHDTPDIIPPYNDGHPEKAYRRAIWKYLESLKVDHAFLNGRAPLTAEKEGILEAMRSRKPSDLILEGFLEAVSPVYDARLPYDVIGRDPRLLELMACPDERAFRKIFNSFESKRTVNMYKKKFRPYERGINGLEKSSRRAASRILLRVKLNDLKSDIQLAEIHKKYGRLTEKEVTAQITDEERDYVEGLADKNKPSEIRIAICDKLAANGIAV